MVGGKRPNPDSRKDGGGIHDRYRVNARIRRKTVTRDCSKQNGGAARGVDRNPKENV